MLRSLVTTLCAIAMIAAVAGCSGDDGPVGPRGPAGPPGPSVILGYGTVDATGAVTVVGPSGTTATAIHESAGRFEVTITGPIPTDEPAIIVSVAGIGPGSLERFALADVDCYAGTLAGGSACNADQIVFEVFIANSTGTAVDDQFSFVVLNE